MKVETNIGVTLLLMMQTLAAQKSAKQIPVNAILVFQVTKMKMDMLLKNVKSNAAMIMTATAQKDAAPIMTKTAALMKMKIISGAMKFPSMA